MVSKRHTLFVLATGALVLYAVVSLWGIVHLITGRASPGDVARALGAAPAPPPPPPSSSFVFRDLATAEDRFFMFPYSYLQKRVEATPMQTTINELGFRGEELHGFRERHPQARVIVVLGGSAAFSHSVPRDGDCFASVLERRLNRAAKPAPGREFRVVNLGMPSAGVLNELVYFVLFGWALKPEVVIAHDGFNDLVYGQITSRPLLEKHAVTYYKVLYEDWARLLAARGQPVPPMPRLDTLEPVAPSNPAEAAVDAYWWRLRQLAAVAAASGAAFVAGLQPLTASKTALSDVEAKRVAGSNRYYQHVYGRMKELYALYLSRHQPAKALPHFVNLHEEFARFGADRTLFVDFMHCNEDGDTLIAEAYERALGKVLAR